MYEILGWDLGAATGEPRPQIIGDKKMYDKTIKELEARIEELEKSVNNRK